jgi:hypothetical protein
MSVEPTEIVFFLERLIEHPAMYAGTPEAAHGMAFALGTVYLAAVRSEHLQDAQRSAVAILEDVTKHVPRSTSQAALLCEVRSHPHRQVSFDAFSENCRSFLIRLEAEAGSPGS